MDTVISRVGRWADKNPDRKAWTFLDDEGKVDECFTYLELDGITSALASHLLSDDAPVKLKQGDRVLLVFFPGLHFMVSLLACFKAGIIAVPVFPPDPRKLKKDLHHFVSIQESSGATTALTHKAYNYAKSMAGAANLFSFSNDKWPEISWFPVDSFIEKNRKAGTTGAGGKYISREVVYPEGTNAPLESDIAFLQYTSGSTSEPKGVMISHGNLAHNEGLIVTELKADEDTINVSWLPQYHDMGLIGSYLGLIYCGGIGVYLSPISFLKDPTIWLRTISAHKGTHTQAPNFAYPLSVRKFKEWHRRNAKTDLDLSSLQHMINAAEPVDAMAIVDFYDTFKKFKLPEDVVIPTFGLAEHCVFVCSDGKQVVMVDKTELAMHRVKVLESRPTMREYSSFVKEALGGQEDSAGAQVIVGCGYPHKGDGVDVRIVEPDTREELDDGSNSEWTGEGRVGEIWIDSQSKAQGYWKRPEQSKEEFQAAIAGSSSDKRFLRTGDLGFYYRRELFICGRIKDVIIVRGSNHYPQDIERTAEKVCSDYLRPGCSAAFALRGDTDAQRGTGEMQSLQESLAHYDKRGAKQGTVAAPGTGTEMLVYIAELKPEVKASQHQEVASAARAAISKDHGLALSVLLLVKPRTIPKTTSGKITRAGCKKALFAKSLQVLYAVSAAAGTGGAETEEDAGLSHPRPATATSPPREGEGNEQEGEPFLAPVMSVEELTALPRKDILRLVENLLVEVTAMSEMPQTTPVDPDEGLKELGVDSNTIHQFKGALDYHLHGKCIPDAFLGTPLGNLNGIALAIKMQGLTPQQQKGFDDLLEGKAIEGEDGMESTQMQKEPYCPWWTCCY